jgi:hypothetical protein
MGNCTPWFWPISRDQRALGVQPIENIAEALAFLADQVLGRNFEIVEEQLAGLVIDHVADRLDRQALPDRPAQIDEEHRQPIGFLADLGQWRGARQKDHQVRMLDAADPHLLAVDDIAIPLADCGRFELRRIRAGRWFGDAHRLQAKFT